MMRPADMRTENERGGLKKLIAKTTFPANFKEKVDMSKVNMETMVPWIQAEVEKYVGFDDEVLVRYVQSQLAPPDWARTRRCTASSKEQSKLDPIE